MYSQKPVFLEVDPSFVENQLRLMKNDDKDEFKNMFGVTAGHFPYKLVKPRPGFCIKTKEVGTGKKVFVNICSTTEIPAPKDISLQELEKIVESDVGEHFKIPMSIGELRTDQDNKGCEAKVCDIAINPTFLNKIETQEGLFKGFFFAVVFQALEGKHGLLTIDTRFVLINKKCHGTLQMHRIQQREIDKETIMKNEVSAATLFGHKKEVPKKVLIEPLPPTKEVKKVRVPEYRLYKKKIAPSCIIGEFTFPDVISSNELTLDIGEDRIVIESKSRGYLLDVFIPYCIRNQKCTSTFNKVSKILTVKMPLIGG